MLFLIFIFVLLHLFETIPHIQVCDTFLASWLLHPLNKGDAFQFISNGNGQRGRARKCLLPQHTSSLGKLYCVGTRFCHNRKCFAQKCGIPNIRHRKLPKFEFHLQQISFEWPLLPILPFYRFFGNVPLSAELCEIKKLENFPPNRPNLPNKTTPKNRFPQ